MGKHDLELLLVLGLRPNENLRIKRLRELNKLTLLKKTLFSGA